MTQLEILRAKVLAYAQTLTFDYPVCLDPTKRRRINEEMQKLTELRSQDRSSRKRITDSSPEILIQEQEELLETLEREARPDSVILKWRRKTPDEYEMMDTRIREEVIDSTGNLPAAKYMKALWSTLLSEDYLGTFSLEGEDLHIPWEEVQGGLLSSGDKDAIGLGLGQFNRETTSVPFTPGSYGSAAMS